MRGRRWACAVAFAVIASGGCKAVDDLQNHLSGAQFAPRLEKLDPASSSFVQRAAPPDDKSEPYVVSHGGAIYLIGGVDGSLKPVPGVYKYDPAGNTYTKLTDWPNPTLPDNFNELGSKICALGGVLLDGTNSADLNCFDPAANAWSKGAAIPSSAGDGGFRNVVFGGKLWTFESSKSGPVAADAGADGGIDADWDAATVGSPPPDGDSSFYAYDPASDAWTQKASSPYVCNTPLSGTGYGRSGMVGIGSTIYVLGCIGASNEGVGGPAFAYDTTKDTWTQIASPPIIVEYSFAMGNKIVVASHVSPFVAVYDTASSTWTASKSGATQPLIPFDWTAYGDGTGLWYFDWADGVDVNHLVYEGEAWRYDPGADTWTKTATLTRDVDSSNRPSFFPLQVGSDVYIAGAWVSAVLTLH